jgi:hypothetical protein
MQLPNQRIGRGNKKIVPMTGLERTQLNQFAFEMWLKIKRLQGGNQTAFTRFVIPTKESGPCSARLNTNVFHSHELIPPGKSTRLTDLNTIIPDKL